ncbi:MAG: general secretion pathway protein GspK [Planctomycetes bacterium]|nr:general secretion pathway protein GspK [Planctomycetota bacterium]
MRPSSQDPSDPERGMALLMVLILSILLYAMVTELVTTSQTAHLVGENELLLARMRNQADYVLVEVEDLLLQDLAAAAAQGENAGAGGGLPAGGAAPGGAAPGGAPAGEAEEEDPAAIADGSQDSWYEPTGYPDDDITTYVWCEAENAKFNVLSLVSPDEGFAEESRKRFVRLLDELRDGTDYDIQRADAERIAQGLIDWMRSRTRSEYLPRIPLKSDEETERRDVSLMVQLDEMLLLPAVTEEMFFDKVLDSRVLPGLEAVLTVYTSLAYDPGDPEERERAAAKANQSGNPPGGAAGQGGQGQGGQGQGGASAAGVPTGGAGGAGAAGAAGAGGEGERPSLVGEGIRINVNLAPRAVLRCLFDAGEISDAVLDAIIRWRNEPVEEDENGNPTSVPEDYLGDVRGAAGPRRKMFTTVEQIDEEIEEFKNLADPALKQAFLDQLTVKSDVFTVHVASMHKRNEETRTYVLQRERSVLFRMDDGESGTVHPLILHEPRNGLRLLAPDDKLDDLLAQSSVFAEMDSFSQEERAWNPFYVDFYRPKHERDALFNYRQYRR